MDEPDDQDEADGLYYDYFSSETDPGLPLPPEPTGHQPGTDGKKQVIAWRLANHYQLHHPLDAGGLVRHGSDRKGINRHPTDDCWVVQVWRTVKGQRRRFYKRFKIYTDACCYLDQIDLEFPQLRNRKHQ